MTRRPRSRYPLFVMLLLLLAAAAPRVEAQTPAPAAAGATAAPGLTVAELMNRLTPQEKIGQLFMVSFVGADTGPESDISRLIRDQHIGNVVLLAANNNFTNNADTPGQIATLDNELQKLGLASNDGVPLLIAADHEGDGFPYQRITGGMTLLPNPMAIGATWDVKNAAAVGEITGRELAALGINLLLGPDVDVLNAPRPTGSGDIGTRTFGGDPWWVAQMGRNYICGVHQGSQGRVATVAKHFPGHGGSDRLPDQEVATVDKSLSELKRIELPPFFAVTQSQEAAPAGAAAGGDCGVTEAMMTSHIRYRGLQGNIRQFTAPISFDKDGLAEIMGLPEFASWQANGLMVSDSLGVPAVGKYFDPTEQTFPHRQIAKEALMAGNDLLMIGEFSRPVAASLQYENVVDTVAYFNEEYQGNPLFRQRVDVAAGRILNAKLKVYGGRFAQENVLVDAASAGKATAKGAAAVTKIAHDSVTLVAPDAAGQQSQRAAPRRDENILIFSDSQAVKDCALQACEWYQPLPLTAVQDTILRLYGPAGSGQVNPARVHSLSFADLKTYLARRLAPSAAITTTQGASGPTPAPAPTVEPGKPDVGKLLDEAQWIIFAMRDANRDNTSDAVRVFLDSGLGSRLETKLVVLAFNAPYFLDTTQVNKLTLYLATYSKGPVFIEAAVRALFGEYVPPGHSPVNIEGTNYDLLRQLSPDPGRPFGLAFAGSSGSEGRNPAGPPPVTVKVQAGPLVDRNGNRAPDGTDVSFEVDYEGDNRFVPAVHGTTVDGRAEATFVLREPGVALLTARSGEAASAQTLRLSIAAPPTPTPTPPLPTATPTQTPAPTVEPSATPAPTATRTPEPSPTPLPPGPLSPGGPLSSPIAGLLLSILGTGVAAAGALFWLNLRGASPSRRVRGLLLCLSGGMAGYIVYLLWLQPLGALPLLALILALAAGLAPVPLTPGKRVG